MKVLIGDDHRLFRDGVRLQLQQFDETLEVLDADDFQEVFERLAATDGIELVLLDLGMPGMRWETALADLTEKFPDVAMVVVSATDDARTIGSALDLGIAGYIPKTSSGEVMINALRLVLAGGVYLPSEVLDRARGPQAATDRAAATRNQAAQLTARQIDVLRLMAEGMSNKEIAVHLDLADGTVKTHASAVLRILDANNRTQAILTAARLGILPPL